MIRFEYQPELKDYMRLSFRFVLPKIRFLLVLAFLSLTAFIIFPFLSHFSPPTSENTNADPNAQILQLVETARKDRDTFEIYRSTYWLLFLPGMMAFALFSVYSGSKKRWQNTPELREKRTYELDETGIRFTATSFSGFLEWHLIAEAEYARGTFFLRTNKLQYHYFSLLAVPDAQALSKLIQSKVPKTKNLDKA